MRRALVALLVFAGATAACRGEAPEAETPRAPAPMPVARTEVAGASWRRGVIVVGGLTAQGDASARADYYDADTNRWERLLDLPQGVHHAAVVVWRNRAFVIGGYTIEEGEWRLTPRVYSLGVDRSEWREEPPIGMPRGAHAAGVVRDRIVVVGGATGAGVANDAIVFDPGAQEWRPGPALARGREHLAVAVAGGRIYAIAGRANGENFTDVESWDGAEPEWRREAPLMKSRGGIAADAVGGKPCVAGGEEAAGTIASIECLHDDGWRVVAALATPRHGLAVATIDGALHVIGGGPVPGLTVSRAHEVFDSL